MKLTLELAAQCWLAFLVGAGMWQVAGWLARLVNRHWPLPPKDDGAWNSSAGR